MRIILATMAAVSAGLVLPAAAIAQDRGDVILDVRVRNEFVDQAGFSSRADALTVRARIGYETPAWRGFKVLVEGEAVAALVDDYNSTTNGHVGYPQIADPAGVELNRLQISWTGRSAEAVVGRQRLILNNARFIGNVGFRQNEQTFDAARFAWRPTPEVTVTYVYVDNVRRVFGEDHPLGVLRSDSHLVQADYRRPTFQASAYGYLLDFPNAPTLSSATWGLRLTGSRPIGQGISITYEAEYARQQDHADNPASFSLDYGAAALGVRRGPSSVSVGLERLDGNGVSAFQTPLATLHAFQGWADVFLTTPVNGVREINIRAATNLDLPGPLRPARLQFAALDFAAAEGGARYGREFDVSLTQPINGHLSFEVKAARFDGSTPGFADRTKVWVSMELRY